MAVVKAIILTLVVTIIAYKVHKFLNEELVLPPQEAQWWGPGKPVKEDTSIRSMKIQVPENVIIDLNKRLKNTRFPVPPLEGIDFQYGFNSETIKKVVNHWLKNYNWTERQKYFNKYPHFITKIQGLDIHFVHIKPEKTAGSNNIPILLIHGWPGSVREYYPLLDVLTDKNRKSDNINFEIIVPSLPGYGWSQGAARPGMGIIQIGVILKELMSRLGHKHYYIQGGDWGSQIASFMGTMYPEEVAGLHLNLCISRTRKTMIYHLFLSIWPSLFMEERFVQKLYPVSEFFKNFTVESGYFHIQATKPDTVGIGLADSPAGLAAYILEKFSTGTNFAYRDAKDGGLTEKFTYDDLIDNLMAYWVTNSMTTAMRLYSEFYAKHNRDLDIENIQTKVPTWCAKFPHDFGNYPDWMLRHRYPELKGSTVFDECGHFVAMECPTLLANDIVLAIKKFEKDNPIFMK